MIQRRPAALALVVGLAASAMPLAAAAHPHGWIDVQTKLVVDAEGRLTKLEQAWLFDELYSSFILEDFRSLGQTVDEGLAELAAADVEALRDYDFFTRLEHDGAKQAFGRVDSYANGVIDGRIWFKFDLPLAEPLAVRGDDLRYSVYDPSYYVEVLHAGGPPIVAGVDDTLDCIVEIVDPAPPSAMIGFAASLDRGATGPDDLGVHFAQWVNVACD
ncbi:MAG: DUF1007 family protein [Pseudomonadota bacterium]